MLNLALPRPFSSLSTILLKFQMDLWACLLSILIFAFLSSCMGVKSSPGPILSDGVKTAPSALVKPDTAAHVRVSETYGRLPLSFEANQGQTDKQVKFFSRGSNYTLFLTSTEAVLVLHIPQHKPSAVISQPSAKSEQPGVMVLRMWLVGANSNPEVTGQEELPNKVHYFRGNDPTKWRTNIPIYAKVHYKNVYPGIDLIYYGHRQQLEYDFIIAPGADPGAIRLAFEGLDKLEVDPQGNLVLQTAGGELPLHKPRIYQEIDGVKQEVSGSYVRLGPPALDPQSLTLKVGLPVAAYDTSRPLIIDPVLVYSSYLGGIRADDGWGIAVDATGHIYVTGFTFSPDFPTTPGAFDRTCDIDGACFRGDAFVTKLDPAGTVVYSTYLGGSDQESPGHGDIAVDGAGNVYVTGWTFSSDFPTTPGAFQSEYQGGCAVCLGSDAFVTKLNSEGSALAYSTYLGGTRGDDFGLAITVDGDGHAYVTGDTASDDFPVTPGVFQPGWSFAADVFVTKLNPTGSGLVYSTYLGGTDYDAGLSIALDSTRNAYVVGDTWSRDFPVTLEAFQPVHGGGYHDGFVTKLNADGSALVYSTYLGGTGFDQGLGIAVDASGNAYVTGQTDSTDFPTENPFQPGFAGGFMDVFVTKLNLAGSGLVYSTYLGGSGNERPGPFGSIAVDASGNAYVTGSTTSTDFPTVRPFQAPGGGLDAFVVKFIPDGSGLVYSTYLGGSSVDVGSDIAVDLSGNAYVTGQTQSSNFPTTPGAFQPAHRGGADAFIAKIADPNFVDPIALLSLNQASFHPGDRLRLEAHLLTPATVPPAGVYLFEAKLWLKTPLFPPSELLSILDISGPGRVASLPPGTDQTVELLDITVPTDIPAGSYEFGLRLRHPTTGEELSVSLAPFEVLPAAAPSKMKLPQPKALQRLAAAARRGLKLPRIFSAQMPRPLDKTPLNQGFGAVRKGRAKSSLGPRVHQAAGAALVAQPTAHLSLNGTSFRVGDPLQLDAQLLTPTEIPPAGSYAFEAKLWLETPMAFPADLISIFNIAGPGPGGIITLPPGFDQTFRVIDTAVPAGISTGAYEFWVRLLHPVTGEELSLDGEPFNVTE